MEIAKLKFNGKIYGKSGSYSVYVNGKKTEVSDSDVLAYNSYLSLLEATKKQIHRALNFIEVQNINVALGGEKTLQELSLDQMTQKIENFPVETLFTNSINGLDGSLVKVTHKGDFVIALWELKKVGEIVKEVVIRTEERLNNVFATLSSNSN